MSGFFQNLLEAVPTLLQASLQCTRTDMEIFSHILHFGSLTCQFLLDGQPNLFRKTLLLLMLLQFLIELRHKHRQQFRVMSNESSFGVGSAEHKSVAAGAEDYRASEMSFQ